MKQEKVGRGEIPEKVMHYLLAGIRRIRFGKAGLIAQDGILMQVEFFTQRRLSCWDDGASAGAMAESEKQHLAAHIRSEFSRLDYGQLTIVIKGGRVVEFQRTEKQRFTGLDGEGI
ncbi:MAG: DUF2292 domain-containing protein [Selenomonadaceae bacterium]|nr:YezD family protein [Selenomonadaceae bacterium]MDY2685775.1 DUF2292 domain-containing protein [Selenomonadaceae bacterium]